MKDPREGYTVAGVSNRDARAVYDVRARAMRELWNDGAADERAIDALGQLLLDALRLELWEARRLTSFAAFAEEVIGIQAGRAEALAEAASVRTGESATPLTERAIALWLRTEAGLYEGDESARARVRGGEHGLVLELSVTLADASTALAGVGARHLPLARSRDDRDRDDRDRDDRGRDDRGRDDRGRDDRGRDDRGYEDARPAPSPERYEEEPEAPSFEAAPEPQEDFAGEAGEDFSGEAADDEASDAGVTPVDERAPAASMGGVKLLTRKHADSESRWGNREAPRPEQGRSDDRPRSNDRRDERPRFGERRDDRPRFNERDRPRPNDRDRPRDDRPRFDRDRPRDDRPRDDRPRFGDRPRDDRPRFGDRPRDDRPRFGDRPRDARPGPSDRPRSNDRRDDRPRSNDRRDERPRFGGDRGGRGPVDRSQRSPGRPGPGGGKFGGGAKFGGGKFGGGAKSGGGKFGGGAKFGGGKSGGGKFGGGNAGKPGQDRGFGARKQFGDKPQPANRRRDQDFDE